MPAVGLPVHAQHIGIVGSHLRRSAAVDGGDEDIAEPAADAAHERHVPAVRRERGADVADVRRWRVGQLAACSIRDGHDLDLRGRREGAGTGRDRERDAVGRPRHVVLAWRQAFDEVADAAEIG